MPTNKQTISVRLDADSKRQIERAARISHQSSGAFLEQAGNREARRVLIEWALERHRQDEMTFSELAEQTGLYVEEIMRAASDDSSSDALDAFLASCRAIAEARGHPEFLRAAEEAVRRVKGRAEV